MKLEIMSASEARAMAEDCAVKVTDEQLTKMVDGVNKRIAYTAKSGKFEYKIHVDDLLGMAGLDNLNENDRKAPVLTILQALRDAGYTAEHYTIYTRDIPLPIVIKW